jgi:hypothetical protein
MKKKFILNTVKSLNGKTIQTPQVDKIKAIKAEIKKQRENK